MINYDGWFIYYKGYIYANKPTGIHDRINNKQIITNASNN